MIRLRTLLLAPPLLVGSFACTSGSPAGPVNRPGTPSEPIWAPASLSEIDAYMDSTNTHGFLLTYRDEPVLEDYVEPVIRNLSPEQVALYQATLRPPTEDGFAVFDVTTIQLGVLGLMASIAVDRGLLDLNASVTSYLGTGWSEAEPEGESQISVRHLLSMTSGLGPDLRIAAEPGTEWGWNPIAFERIHLILPEATGQPMQELLDQWLVEPLNLSFAEWESFEEDPSGRINLATSLRDLAAIGHLLSDGGRFEGAQVVSEVAVSRILTPSQELNPSWGIGWWLNGQSRHVTREGDVRAGSVIPNAPADMFFAFGEYDQVVGVLPSRDVVAVRMGAWVFGPQATRPLERLWELITRTAPR